MKERIVRLHVCSPFNVEGSTGRSVRSTWPGGRYKRYTGPSMACAHVSGAAALVWGSRPNAKNVTIRRLLAWRVNEQELGSVGRDDYYGYGLVDAARAACEQGQPPKINGIP